MFGKFLISVRNLQMHSTMLCVVKDFSKNCRNYHLPTLQLRWISVLKGKDMSTATSPKRSQPEITANVSCLWGPVVTTSQVTTHSIIPATSTPIRDTGRHLVQKTETITKVKNTTDRVSEHVTYGKTLVAMVNDLTNRVVELQKTMEDVKSKLCTLEHVSGASVQVMHCSIPVRNAWEFKRLNEKLEEETFYEQMLNFLIATGTRTVGECVRQIMRTLIADCFLHKLNWRGVHGRQSFANTKVCRITVDAVTRHNFPGVTTIFIHEKIQRWIQRCRPTEVSSTESPFQDVAVQTDSVEVLESSRKWTMDGC
nr:unnamed protein product [Fasciola hepatica]